MSEVSGGNIFAALLTASAFNRKSDKGKSVPHRTTTAFTNLQKPRMSCRRLIDEGCLMLCVKSIYLLRNGQTSTCFVKSVLYDTHYAYIKICYDVLYKKTAFNSTGRSSQASPYRFFRKLNPMRLAAPL